MTRRATFTQAELQRAIRAAEGCGKVAVLTVQGIVFAESADVALPSPADDPFSNWKAKREGRIEGRS